MECRARGRVCVCRGGWNASGKLGRWGKQMINKQRATGSVSWRLGWKEWAGRERWRTHQQRNWGVNLRFCYGSYWLPSKAFLPPLLSTSIPDFIAISPGSTRPRGTEAFCTRLMQTSRLKLNSQSDTTSQTEEHSTLGAESFQIDDYRSGPVNGGLPVQSFRQKHLRKCCVLRRLAVFFIFRPGLLCVFMSGFFVFFG